MEYHRINNLLVNTLNHPSKFRTINWVERNDEVYQTYIKPIVRLNLKLQK